MLILISGLHALLPFSVLSVLPVPSLHTVLPVLLLLLLALDGAPQT